MQSSKCVCNAGAIMNSTGYCICPKGATFDNQQNCICSQVVGSSLSGNQCVCDTDYSGDKLSTGNTYCQNYNLCCTKVLNGGAICSNNLQYNNCEYLTNIA
ncbi:Hypothetical_protein [Hexamita inflata]|uniref:Hypothetical_protein n=1 Tax=Hexamita inflata TaxID=28002 RepID=A0AA86V5P1_9EUKA|nr:Hypothetical protein HINF_LOCUS65026 [Hexamita inflata]